MLDALAAASPRFRGIRHAAAWDKDASVLGAPFHHPEGLYRDATFREGFAELGKRGMTFDAWLLEPQLPDLIDLARAFPDQPICLDHVGTPVGLGSYKGRLPDRFDEWRRNILELARCENVVVKLGGLAMAFCALPEDGPVAVLHARPRPFLGQVEAERHRERDDRGDKTRDERRLTAHPVDDGLHDDLLVSRW